MPAMSFCFVLTRFLAIDFDFSAFLTLRGKDDSLSRNRSSEGSLRRWSLCRKGLLGPRAQFGWCRGLDQTNGKCRFSVAFGHAGVPRCSLPSIDYHVFVVGRGGRLGALGHATSGTGVCGGGGEPGSREVLATCCHRLPSVAMNLVLKVI